LAALLHAMFGIYAMHTRHECCVVYRVVPGAPQPVQHGVSEHLAAPQENSCAAAC
jgi:hypothetical protein